MPGPKAGGGDNPGGRGGGRSGLQPAGDDRSMDDLGHSRAGKRDGGVGEANRGRGESSPGHMKREAGEQSARDFAPGHGGTPPGQLGRDRGENAVETPEADSFEREA